MRRLLRKPAELARAAWSFVDPPRTAGRIPYGRLVIAVQIVVALAFVGYTLGKKSIRLPFSSEPYQVQVLMANAQGLDRLDEPAAAVAGTPLGRVSTVELRDGQALVTLTFDEEVRGKIFADASASVRPASALQNLLVNIDPGTPSAGPLPDGQPIPPDRAAGYVTIDELTSVLDVDTQAYLTILIEQAETALRGRENEIAGALAEVGELTDTAAPLSRTLAERRRLLTQLVGELEVVTQTLGKRGKQLAEAIDAGTRTLEITAARRPELAAATRRLAPVLSEAEASLRGVRELAAPLLPALAQLIPAAEPLGDSLAHMREILPRAEALTDRFEALVADGREPLRLMLEGTRGVTGRVDRMVPVMHAMTDLARRLDRRREGMGQLADTLSAAFSSQDNNGAYAPIDLVTVGALHGENFGLDLDGDARKRRQLERGVARALETVCLTENRLACVFRFNIPGLPEEPVLRDVPLPEEGR